MGVVGEVGPVRLRANSGAAALASDLLLESVLRPSPGGWNSRFLRRWERAGAHRWRLEFLPGVRFSDGSLVQVGDVAEALRRRGLKILSSSAAALDVEAVGGTPLEVDLSLAEVARLDSAGRPLGTGPYAVALQEPGRLVLERIQPVPGRIRRVEFVPCATSREALVRLLRGELDAIPSLDPAHAELLEGVPRLRVIRGNAPHASVVALNPRLPAAERRALARAIPLAEIAAAIRREPCCANGQQTRPMPPAGRPLTIGYPRTVEFRRAALALRQALGPRGGDLRPVEIAKFLQRAKEFDLIATAVLVRPPGIIAAYLRSGSELNWVGYANPRYDAALAAGDEAAADEALAEDPALLVVARRERVAAVDSRLANARLGDWGILELLPEWEVSP